MRSLALMWLLVVTCTSSVVMAENEGLEALDKATDLKLTANSRKDLLKVVELCQEAIEAGLDEANTMIAKQVMAASAFKNADAMWQQFPRLASNPDAARRIYKLATEDLAIATEANPKMAEAWIMYAKIEALVGGKGEKAKEYVDNAIKHLGDKPVDLSKAYILRAGLQSDDDAKLADLDKAVKVDPTNSAAWQARITMQMMLGKIPNAVEDAKKLIEDGEETNFAMETAVTSWVDSLLNNSKADLAIGITSLAVDKFAESSIYLRQRARAHRYKSFDEELTEEQREEARELAFEDLNKAIELEPQDYEALVMRGEIYYEKGEVDKANRDIADSLQIEPTGRGLLMRSMVAASEGRYGEAITDMEMLVRAVPNNTPWVLQLASYYQMDNRPRRAVRLIDQLLKAEPENWRAMRLRADAKLAIGDHSEAVLDYEDALAIVEEKEAVAEDEEQSDIDYSGLLNNLSWVLATSPQDSVRDGKRALELGLQACEVTEYKAAHILSTLAAAYAETGDFENARKWSAKAVELGAEDEEQNQLEQLKKELESYKKNEPWREEQETQENDEPLIPASETIDT